MSFFRVFHQIPSCSLQGHTLVMSCTEDALFCLHIWDGSPAVHLMENFSSELLVHWWELFRFCVKLSNDNKPSLIFNEICIGNYMISSAIWFYYEMFREMSALRLVITRSLYFHKARALRHTSALLRYNACSLRHRYERAEFTIHFIKEIKNLVPRALSSYKHLGIFKNTRASLHFSRVLKNSRVLI